MPRFRFALLLAVILVAVFKPGTANDDNNFNPSKWQAFSVEDLAAAGHEENIFLHEDTIHAGLYLRPNYRDVPEGAYRYDTLYIVTEGELSIQAGYTVTKINPGDVAFVRAGIQHSLNPFPEATYLRVSPTSASSPEDPVFRVFAGIDIRKAWKRDENEWNPFLQVSSMTFGLYMLPLALNGDQTLTHEMDEINIVIKGEARFRMDNDEIDVGPGSVMWVKAGVGHYFHDLSEDFEVLIMFRQNGE